MKPYWLHFYVNEADKKVSVLKEETGVPVMSVQVYGDDTELAREMADRLAKEHQFELEWLA
jgi:hypothetical protein